MAKGATRPQRARGVCKAAARPGAQNWIGSVEKLSSNNDGNGVLAMRISDNIVLKTWNNAFSDISDHTLLDPNGEVFRQAVALKEGQMVRFSGSFIRSATDCFEEGSMTIEGSMDEPEYLFRFTSVAPVE